MSGIDSRKSSGNSSFIKKLDTIGLYGEGVPDSEDAVDGGQGITTLAPAAAARKTSDPSFTSSRSKLGFGRVRAISSELAPSPAGLCRKSGFLPRMTRQGTESNLNIAPGMTEGDVDWLETMLPGVMPLSGLTG